MAVDEMESGIRTGEAQWARISGALSREIAAGTLGPGARLPSESELAAHYQVNRHTVRRALDALAAARLIRTEHGRGSFVAEDVLDYRVGKRPRFSAFVKAANRTPMGEILRLEEILLAELAEAEAAAKALHLQPSQPVILLERLGMADGRPVALSRHIFCARSGLAAALNGHDSVTAALAAIGIADFTRDWTRVCARLPDEREARLLKTARTEPVLACENLDLAPGGEPLEFGATIYPGARIQLVFGDD